MGGGGCAAGDGPGPVQEPVPDTTATPGCSTHLLAREAAAAGWAEVEVEVEAGKAEYGCTVPGEARQRGQDMGIIGDCGVQPQPSPTRHCNHSFSRLTELDTYISTL